MGEFRLKAYHSWVYFVTSNICLLYFYFFFHFEIKKGCSAANFIKIGLICLMTMQY